MNTILKTIFVFVCISSTVAKAQVAEQYGGNVTSKVLYSVLISTPKGVADLEIARKGLPLRNCSFDAIPDVDSYMGNVGIALYERVHLLVVKCSDKLADRVIVQGYLFKFYQNNMGGRVAFYYTGTSKFADLN